jgi:hypothetical protein
LPYFCQVSSIVTSILCSLHTQSGVHWDSKVTTSSIGWLSLYKSINWFKKKTVLS